MKNISEITQYLKSYDGAPISIMEVCGTHTGAIASLGLRSILSDKISLVSGPGCPVCVTVSEYIDRLCSLAKEPDTTIATFGDMIRVNGSTHCLQDAMADGADIRMVYSPFEILRLAKENPHRTYIFAAVGFETTTPIYAMIINKAIEQNIKNIKFLTSLKIMPPAIRWICSQNPNIDGFIGPGHVSVIAGSNLFDEISNEYSIPFAVAGFDANQILAAIYTLIKKREQAGVYNLYREVVTDDGNIEAKNIVFKYFETGNAAWRGIGEIQNSGLYIKKEYARFDAGSYTLFENIGATNGCICGSILTGKATPADCPLFLSNACTPESPQGACMVSQEGCCNCFKRGGLVI